MGIRELIAGGQKSAAETLKALEEKIATLEGQADKLYAEKSEADRTLADRLKADAVGEAELSEADHKRLHANISDIELRRQRIGASIDALKGQIPELKQAVIEEQAAAVLARLAPVNTDIRKTALELQKAAAKVREITGRLAGLYDQADDLEREHADVRRLGGEKAQNLPDGYFPYPHPASFKVWKRESEVHLDEYSTDWMSDSPEKEAAKQEAAQRQADERHQDEEKRQREWNQFMSEWNASLNPRKALGLSTDAQGIPNEDDFKSWKALRGMK